MLLCWQKIVDEKRPIFYFIAVILCSTKQIYCIRNKYISLDSIAISNGQLSVETWNLVQKSYIINTYNNYEKSVCQKFTTMTKVSPVAFSINHNGKYAANK
jgi:hypothetical protein